MLRAMLNADSKNEVARYDAAFALGEVSATLISLGELAPAQTQLTEALSILSNSSLIAETKLNDARVLLGLGYFRLGLTHALRAAQPSATRAERNEACEEARRWFALGEPILTAASARDDWQSLTRGTAEQMAQQAQICTKVLTAAQ